MIKKSLYLFAFLFIFTTAFAQTAKPPVTTLSANIYHCGVTRLIWQVPANTTATSWKIYRATSTAATYNLIVSTTSPSYFVNIPGSGAEGTSYSKPVYVLDPT